MTLDASRVLFVVPEIYPGTPYQPHLGIAYLMSMLKRQGVKVKVLDMGLGYSVSHLFEVIDHFNPSLVGITSFSYQCVKAYHLIDQIKAQRNLVVVYGGPHVSAMRGQVLAETKADFAVKGEGEITFIELLKTIVEGQSPQGIAGLIRRRNGEIVEEVDRPFLEELDAVPFPDFEEFELQRYLVSVDKRLSLITSRGCPYRCVYCSVKVCMGTRFRARSPENVVSEIEHWYRKGWGNFDIDDDCFSFDLERAKRICDLVVARGISINYKLYNGIRVDRVDEELLFKMKQTGCTRIAYGVESGNPKVLKDMKKGITLDTVRRAVEMANTAGIDVSLSFIIGHVGETYEEAMDTINFAKGLSAKTFVFYNMVPYPGTEIFEWIKEHGSFRYSVEDYLYKQSPGELEPIFETKEFPLEQRKKALKIADAAFRRKDLQYRLGRTLGIVAYYLSNITPLWHWAINFVTRTKIGMRVFNLLKRHR